MLRYWEVRMRVTAPVVLIGLVAGVIAASAQAPGKRGWVDRFDVDKKAFVSAGANDYFRLEPGFYLVLEKGKERLVITVLDETRIVDGVETRIVEERETKGGELVEISRNFFAFNTADRGVYYFGEEVDIYKDGRVVHHEGAWESGKKGARFGLMMPGRPEVGARYYQEIAPDTALDRAEVASVRTMFETPAGVFENCLKTIETSPLEPFARESKVYAPGVGLIKDGPLRLVAYGKPEGR